MARQTIAISAQSTVDTTSAGWTKVTLSPGGNLPNGHTSLGDQVVRVSASFSTNGATATGRFVLRDTTTVYKSIDVTLAATAVRSAAAGASGDYVASVSINGSDYADVAGAGDGRDWYFGVPTLSGGTMNVYLDPLRAI